MTPVGIHPCIYMSSSTTRGAMLSPACSVLLHKQANVTLAGHVTGTSISVIAPERKERDERGVEAEESNEMISRKFSM